MVAIKKPSTVQITKASNINFLSVEARVDFENLKKENASIQKSAQHDLNKLQILILPKRFRR